MLNVGSGLALLGLVQHPLHFHQNILLRPIYQLRSLLQFSINFFSFETLQTTVLCDFVILYFTKRRRFYKEVKYLLVDGDDVEVMFIDFIDCSMFTNMNIGFQEQTLISTATPRTSYDSAASNMSHGT